MSALIPTIVLAAAGSAVAAGVFFYLANATPGDRYLRLFGIGYAVLAVRECLNAVAAAEPALPAVAVLADLVLLTGVALLLAAAAAFCGRRLPAVALGVGWGLVAAWIVLTAMIDLPMPWRLLPQYLVFGGMLAAAGVLLWRHSTTLAEPEVRAAAVLLVLRGVHVADYPFGRTIEWFAPYGFALNTLLSFCIAALFVVLGYRRQMRAAQGAHATAVAQEAALAASVARLRAVVERAPIVLVSFNREGTVELSEGRGLADLGLRPGQLVGGSMRTLMADRPDWLSVLDRALAGEEVRIEMDWAGRRYDAHYAPDRDDAGAVRGVIIVALDVTERWQAEQALQSSRQRLSSFFVESPAGMAVCDREGRLTQLNPTLARIIGTPTDDLVGRRLGGFFSADTAARVEALIGSVLATGEPQINQELSGTMAAEPRRMRHWLYSLFPLDGSERQVEALGLVVIETTALKEAEAHVRQTQRLEAVGTLTGGVAHDFNNLLAVISGNLELISDALGTRPDLRQKANAALRATDRGATLTRSLLAFSRQQALQPGPVDLNRLVADTSDLLRRTIPASISLNVVGTPALWLCRVDAGQLQNALLNLVANARDAMPGGGSLTIETCNVTLAGNDATVQAEVIPGEYVMLAVRDTGMGMPPDIIAQAFVPFFTTKEVGKGTGLGLSMVYGFAKQSDGHVTIDSEVGAGTIVRLYLPRYREAVGEHPAPPPKSGAKGGGEKILVVEDDPDVLALLSAQLTSLGYRVREARDGAAALQALEANGDVALLLSDVILPGRMNGAQVADRVRSIRPGLPVVFISGYTENALLQDGTARTDVRLLQKPFTKPALAAIVRAALDEG